MQKLRIITTSILVIAIFSLATILLAKYVGVSKSAEGPNKRSSNRTQFAGEGLENNTIRKGSLIQLGDLNWSRNGNTLLVFASEKCGYCRTSSDFYQRLSQALSGAESVKLTFVIPPSEDPKFVSTEWKIEGAEVIRYPFGLTGVRGTPTIALVDGNGIVLDYWLGKLKQDGESKLIASLSQLTGTDLSGYLSVPELDSTDKPGDSNFDRAKIDKEMELGNQIAIVDLRDRRQYSEGHLPDAKNIPHDEIEVRAFDELPSKGLVILVCQGCPESTASFAKSILDSQGFRTGYYVAQN